MKRCVVYYFQITRDHWFRLSLKPGRKQGNLTRVRIYNGSETTLASWEVKKKNPLRIVKGTEK